MSRIGKLPVKITTGVTVEIAGDTVTVKGPKGEISQKIMTNVTVTQQGDELIVTRKNDEKKSRSNHGLVRSLLANMVQGVTEGFMIELDIIGVGYRAKLVGQDLELSLGFSHPVKVAAPAGISFELPTETELKIHGFDKQLIGQVAAKIRKYRKPEPFKGKGIRYKGEYVKIKEKKV